MSSSLYFLTELLIYIMIEDENRRQNQDSYNLERIYVGFIL